jgi:hypothetical protein
MTIRLNGSTSGYTEIDAPAVAGNNTLVFPGGNGTADQALVTNGSGTLSFADRGRMVLETAKASTSGTNVDFTGIPSWVKRVTVMFNGVSTNGGSQIQFQLGTSSGVETSGYSGGAGYATSAFSANSSGFLYADTASANSSYARTGAFYFTTMGSNVWAVTGNSYTTSGAVMFSMAGAKTLSGTLDRIRITTVNGTDTFDAGSINILYEG